MRCGRGRETTKGTRDIDKQCSALASLLVDLTIASTSRAFERGTQELLQTLAHTEGSEQAHAKGRC